MSKGPKWYVVWEGLTPGVYDSWQECQEQIQGYPRARYKSFASHSDALRAYEDGYELYRRQHYGSGETAVEITEYPILDALSVDAACSGNPGVMEYRGVLVADRREIFRVGPFAKGTNNIGEFLAIVHGLSLLKKHNLSMPIYTDSITAMAWVRNRKCKTLLPRNAQTEQLLDLVLRAEQWLRDNAYTTKILKWDTPRWGEIPADFGRK